METAQTNQVTDALTDAMANACTACAAKVWNGGACRYHELVGRSNSTTTAMALAAVTAIVFIVPLSQIESRIAPGTRNQIFKKGLRHCATPWGHTVIESEMRDIPGTHLRRKNS